MKAVKFLLIIGSIVAFFLVCQVSYAENTPEGIILFDQSGSMKKCDPELRSRALIVAFVRSLKKPYKIVLAGFNEEIHEYITLVAETETDMEALAGKIEKIGAASYSTDLEIPFRYLLERDGKEAIEFALIISDGKPDIWDGKLRHFSKRVKFDQRYEDLNRQYHVLKASGLSPDALFDRLGHLYHKRNLELIEEQVSRLKDGLGNRIVLCDLSGESGFFKTWAEGCGGRYLPMKAEEDVPSVDHLRNVMSSLLGISSFVAREPLSEDHETHPESALPAVLEPESVALEAEIGLEPKPETAPGQRPERVHTTVTSQPPSPDLGDEPGKPAEQTPKQISRDVGDGWTITAALAFFVLAGVGCTIVFCRLRKRALRAERKKELEAELEAEIGRMKEQRFSELEAEVGAKKEKGMQELEEELREYRKSVEQEVEAEKERRLSELESEILAEKQKKVQELESEMSSMKEERLSEMEAELAAEKERKMQELEKELAEHRESVEQEMEAEKERRMRELEAVSVVVPTDIEAESAERKKELEAEIESEISSMKEEKLSEMEAELAAEKQRRMEEFEKELSEYLKSVEVEVKAEKERRMEEFEKELSEYLKSVEVEVKAEKERRMRELEARSRD